MYNICMCVHVYVYTYMCACRYMSMCVVVHTEAGGQYKVLFYHTILYF